MEASFTIDDLSSLINIMKASNLSSMSTSEMASKLTVLKLRKQDKHAGSATISSSKNSNASISSPDFMFKPPSKVLGTSQQKDNDILATEFQINMNEQMKGIDSVASDAIDKSDKNLDINSKIFNTSFTKSKEEFTIDSSNKSFVSGISGKRNGKPRRGATPHKSSNDESTKFSSLFKENLNPLSNNSTERNDKEWHFDTNITSNNMSSPVQSNKFNFSEPLPKSSLFDHSNVSTSSPSVFISKYSPLFMDTAIPGTTKIPISKSTANSSQMNSFDTSIYASPDGLFSDAELQGIYTYYQ
jgi:hypothetical protein